MEHTAKGIIIIKISQWVSKIKYLLNLLHGEIPEDISMLHIDSIFLYNSYGLKYRRSFNFPSSMSFIIF